METGAYQYLDLREGGGSLLGPLWERDSPSLGGCWTPNTGPKPRSEDGGSTLWEILEDNPPPKYYLSRKACLGILRRSKERGKPLPPQLEAALRIQAGIDHPPPPGCEQASGAICLMDQGGQRMDCAGNLSGTLCAGGHTPLVSVYENHGIDARYTGPLSVAPTMSACYGEGGNNIPLVGREVICIAGNAIGRRPQNGGNGMGYQADISYTLTSMDRHAVFARQRTDMFKQDALSSTQSARQYKDATDLVSDPSGNSPLLIRRLTELECERLQGYPDGWTDLPGASGSARYRALGNSIAVPCGEYVLRGIAAVLRNAV